MTSMNETGSQHGSGTTGASDRRPTEQVRRARTPLAAGFLTRGRSAVLSALTSAAVLVAVVVGTAPASEAATSTCATTVASGWSASVCLAVSGTGTLTGPVTVSATADVSTSGPRVAKLEFSLRGLYLLTDYAVPYSFTLDTADYVDGAAALSVIAIFRDGSTSTPATVNLNFNNGVNKDPNPSGSFTPPTAPVATKTNPLLLAAVGDGAGGEQAATDVTSMIKGWNPGLFTYLGDVYDNGTITEFKNWYGDSTSWYGQLRPITAPVVGNHEYNKNPKGSYVADGYFRYWNNIPHYYSFNAGGWHFIALDSTSQFGETDPGTAQYTWLQNDLATHAGQCTIALWHHPLNSVGSEAPAQRMSAIWSLLAQNKVSLVLNGHDHQYQRWAALDGAQQPKTTGVTEIVAGAGGHSSQGIQSSDSRVVTTAQAYGALRMQVFPDRVDYTYRTPDGSAGKVLDSGFVGCQSLSADTTKPTPPASITATLRPGSTSTYSADLAWPAGDDDRGVAQYRIRANGAVVATIPSADLTYVAKGLKASTSYSFTVSALDAAGNESAQSPPATLTTPAPQPVSLTVTATADAYTNDQQPTHNYGRSTSLRLDVDPLNQSYVRFTVAGSWSTVTKATLRVYGNQKSATGFTVKAVPSTWDEYGLTAANAPSAGAVVGTAPGYSAGWVDVDVTPAVVGNGTYSFMLSTGQSTAFTLGSRESAQPPQLIVESEPPPDTTAPTTPTGLTAVAPAQDHVDLAWNASSDNDSVDSYTIYRNGTAIDSVSGTTTTYVDTNVQAATTYTYAVDAVDPTGNQSAKSATASATPPDETPPELVDGIDAVLTGPDSVGVRWGAATDNVGVTGYRLQRNGTTIATLPASTTSFDDTSLTAGQTYTYAVTATDAAGNRSEAITGSVTVPTSGGSDAPPSTPTNVTATATGETEITLEWTQSTDDTGISGYEIFRGSDSVGLVGASADAWLDSGLTPNTSYSYTVRAIDLSGQFSDLSSPPAAATTWAVDTTPPTVPGGVTATGASTTSIAVAWSASTDARGVTGYRVYRDGSAVADVDGTTTTWTDTGLAIGSTHSYQVDAVDGAGNRSAKSSAVQGKTQVPAPTTATFIVDADAYVNAGSPTSKYGSATSLRLDGSPEVDTWLHFTTSGLQPKVTSAVLRIYANGKNSSGFDVHTSSAAWSESTISFATAPAFGSVVASADPTSAAGWVEVPVTATVTANGDITFVLTQTGPTAVSYASRELGGATAAQLVVTSGY
jgi:chitodextrinase